MFLQKIDCTVFLYFMPLLHSFSVPPELNLLLEASWSLGGDKPSIICFTILLCPKPSAPASTVCSLNSVSTNIPLLNFSARSKGEGVEVIIQFKDASVPVHTYYFELHPRDLDHPQFEWSFQRQLYDALHDYFVEMFIRTPQDRVERRQRGS